MPYQLQLLGVGTSDPWSCGCPVVQDLGQGRASYCKPPWGRWHSAPSPPHSTLHALNSSASLRLRDSQSCHSCQLLLSFQIIWLVSRSGIWGSEKVTWQLRLKRAEQGASPHFEAVVIYLLGNGRPLITMAEGLHSAFSSPWRSPCPTQATCSLREQARDDPPTKGEISSCLVTEGVTFSGAPGSLPGAPSFASLGQVL